MALSRSRLIIAGVLLTLAVTAAGARQGSAPHAALPFTVIAADSRRPLAATLVGDYVMVSLEDLAALFQLTVREDALAGGVTVSYKGKTVILTPGQALASAAGRLISLPSPLTRDGRRWLVPVEFVSRALAVVYDSRLDVRKNSRMVIVGDVRVPHIVVRQDVLGPQTRVTFAVNPRTPYTLSQEPSRVLVHFDADALDVSLPTFAPQGLLQSIRVSDPSTTITIDVGPRFGSFRATLVPQDDGGGQVLVDLMPATAEPAPSPLARGGVPQLPVPPAPEAPPPVTSPTAGGLSAVVIDPGHGGDEVGSKGAAGTQEKDVTLSLARRLKASLEGRLGVRVLLTRDGDQAIGLDARAALANNTKADLFVSLHANASMRREASGAQIYYMAADQSVEDVRMATASRQTLPTFSGGSREVGMVPWNMAQLRHLSESASLAGAIEEQFRGRVRLNTRPVQQAPLRVLTGANMPAVLVEVGFLTNLDEEQQLVSDAYQNTVVQALLDGLLRYRQLADLPAPPEAVPSPSHVPVRRLP
ncbi:MAG TPA: N-acetylmuramoyl-L-alanine amidase [Vicinamibacterales bacterium]